MEQSVGRVFRQKASDRRFHPLIIDIQDIFSFFEKQCQKRIKFYKKSNFTLFKNGEEMQKTSKKKTSKAKAIEEFILID